MPSTTPPGIPSNPTGFRFGETPIQARKIVALPRHFRGKPNLQKSFAQGSDSLVLNPFRSLVASPATPNTPTPVPTLGSGYNSSSFNTSSFCASATPERSFSSYSTSSLSPPDSPYPSTPTVSPFDTDPHVVGGSQNEVDPFEISARVIQNIEKESSSLLDNAGGMVRLTETSADVPGLERSTRNLEKSFTGDATLFFHDPPRQYTPGQKMDTKSNSGASSAVFVLRSSQIIEEEVSSDEESESEDRDNDDKATYSFPCEDSKINELVSKLASLSLGTISAVSRPTITPTRVRTRVFPSVPARTPVSSPVAAFHPVVGHPSAAQHATPMEVDEDVPDRKVANRGATYPQKISEAVPMDGVVFHPEVKDVEMADAFATDLGAAPFTPPTRGVITTRSASCQPRSVLGTTWDPKSTSHRGQRTDFGAPPSPSQLSHVPQHSVFDFLCQSPKAPVFPGSRVSPAGARGSVVNSYAL